MGRRILIVGGGYAGALCAIRMARKVRKGTAEIVLANARPWFVERIRLHQDAAGDGPRRRSLATMLAGTGVRLRVGTALAVDLGERRASFAEASTGEARHEAFDELVLATGSVASVSGIAGLARAWSCATEESSLALRAHLARIAGGRVVIIGGGLTGIELATELREERPDLHVTLVSGGDVAFMLGERGRAHVRRALDGTGIDVELMTFERNGTFPEGEYPHDRWHPIRARPARH